MAVLEVKNLEGKTVGKVELADSVFAARVNPHLLHEAVRWYRAGLRAGTHQTKTRGEVQGAGRKLWRQKGTGRARVGSIRSPLWRHGGTVHGPQPRDYSYRLPRKMVLGALRSALSQKLAGEKLTVVDAWTLETHKTKSLRQVLDKLNGESRTILVVENGVNRNLELASRNLEGVLLVPSWKLQPYDLLRHDHLVLSKDAALRLSSGLAVEEQAAAPAESRPAPRSKPVAEAPAAERKTKAAARAKKPAVAAKSGKKAAAKPRKKKD